MVRTTVPGLSGGTLRPELVVDAASGQIMEGVQAVAWRLCDADSLDAAADETQTQTQAQTRVATAVLRVPRVVVIALHTGQAAADQVPTLAVPR